MGREFERDMEDYLRARRRPVFDIKKILDKFVNRPKKVDMPEEVEVYHEKEEPPKKESLLFKLFKKELPEEEVQRAKMQADDAVSDMKEVSKITLNMIRQLPDEELKKFKESSDFETMKNILKKHELIK